MGIGLRIKNILYDRKMTIKQLSEESGVSINTLYSITKRDSDNVDPVILHKLSTALNVSQEELLGHLVVSFSDVLFENDDGQVYTFESGTYLSKVATVSHGLKKDDRDLWLKIGNTMVDLDSSDRQRIADYTALLANQPKEKPPQD